MKNLLIVQNLEGGQNLTLIEVKTLSVWLQCIINNSPQKNIKSLNTTLISNEQTKVLKLDDHVNTLVRQFFL